MSQHTRPGPDRRADRQDSADERQAAYEALTLQEKLRRAIARGHVGTREALRLAQQEVATLRAS